MGTLGLIFLVIVVCILMLCATVAIAKTLFSWAFTALGFVIQGVFWLVTLPFVWIGKALFGK